MRRCAEYLAGTSATMASKNREQATTPVKPPIKASNTLSVRSCHAMRARPAPIAVRTASSRSRVVEAASVRFATFKHAMSKTSATAPPISNGTVPARLVMKFRSGSSDARSSALNMLGNCWRKSPRGRVRTSSACARVASDLSRPRQSSPPLDGLVLVSGTRIGSHKSACDAPASGNSKSFGRTPTMVWVSPSRVIARPTIVESP